MDKNTFAKYEAISAKCSRSLDGIKISDYTQRRKEVAALKIKLDVSHERYFELKSLLEEYGFEIADDADLVLSEPRW